MRCHRKSDPANFFAVHQQEKRKTMNETVTSIKTFLSDNFSIKQIYTSQFWKLAAGALLLTSLVACATVPSEPADSDAPPPDIGLTSANVMYNTRNYTGAVREFDTIITDTEASANNRRMSHLGKALIYLSSDKNWHSIENAKMSLNAAGQVAPESNKEFSIETDMLMDSITALIGSESEYLELQAKSGNSGAEIARLKKERDALTKERDGLLKEQQALNDALETLKNLTLES